MGGDFLVAGGVTVNSIARWNPTNSSWNAIGATGLNSGYCDGIGVDSTGSVYACGTFTSAGGVASNRVAKWNGSVWSPLTTGLGVTSGNAIAIDSSNNVYIGGDYTTAGGLTANSIAKWTPGTSSWSVLAAGLGTGGCLSIATRGDYVYAGGSFVGNTATVANSSPAKLATYDKITNYWTPIGGSFTLNRTTITTSGIIPLFTSIRPIFVPKSAVGLMQVYCLFATSAAVSSQYNISIQVSTDFAFTSPITIATDIILNATTTLFPFITQVYNQTNIVANQAYYWRARIESSSNTTAGPIINSVRNFSLVWANT